jgi:CRP-like cAMP-binding protein
MSNQTTELVSAMKINWNEYRPFLKKIEVPAKKRLLNEGEVSDKLFIIESGCVRIGYRNKTKDTTFQFFFENEVLTSIESLFDKKPSRFFIETIEPTKVYYMDKEMLDSLVTKKDEMKSIYQQIMLNKLMIYSSQILSYIQESPQERFYNILRTRPQIIQRVPQRYIASYLGITHVSLSRIKNRYYKQERNIHK